MLTYYVDVRRWNFSKMVSVEGFGAIVSVVGKLVLLVIELAFHAFL